MFAVTFLGHQGWLVATARTRLLVDPLLVEAFGHGGEVGAVYPPRALDVARVPPVHGVLLTHEHEGHFSLPSLHRLDRAIPVYLSARASDAARAVLGEMGFRVHAAAGGAPFAVGDLEVHAFDVDPGEAVDRAWEQLQYLVRDRAGDGSLFGPGRVPPSDRTWDALRAAAGAPGLWCHADDSAAARLARGPGFNAGAAPAGVPGAVAAALDAHAALRARWGPPAAALLCGGGFAFGPDRAALNHQVFEADAAQTAAALAAAFPGQAFAAVTPGQTVAMAGGRLAGGAATAPFLAPRPRAAWPARAFAGARAPLADYAPFAPRRALAPGDLDDLARHLADLAHSLYGERLFRAVYATRTPAVAGRRPRPALVLRDDAAGAAGRHVFEYAPEGCAFVRVASADPAADYVCGLECWATDLLALFRGEAGPASVVFGRGRAWSHAPEFGLALAFLLHHFSPLRRPAAFLRLYRRLAAREPPDAPRVPAGGPAG